MNKTAILITSALLASSAYAGDVYLGASATYGQISTGEFSSTVYGGEVELGYEFGKTGTGAHRVKLLANGLSTGEVAATYGASAKYNEKLDLLAARVGYSYHWALSQSGLSSFYLGVNGGAVNARHSVAGTVVVDAFGNTESFSSSAAATTFIVGAELGFNLALSTHWALNVGVEANVTGGTKFTHEGVTIENDPAKILLGKVGISYRF